MTQKGYVTLEVHRLVLERLRNWEPIIHEARVAAAGEGGRIPDADHVETEFRGDSVFLTWEMERNGT